MPNLPIRTVRGPYKRYLRDPEVSVPKKTLQRMRRENEKLLLNEHLADDFESDEEQISFSNGSNAGSDSFEDEVSSCDDSDDYTNSESASGSNSDNNSNNCDGFSDSDSLGDLNEDDSHSEEDNNDGNENACPPVSNVDQPENVDTAVTEEQLTLVLQAFALRHRLTRDALQDLLQIIDVIAPGTLSASSAYLFKKQFQDTSLSSKKHFVCVECMSYIGPEGEIEVSECSKCDEPVNEQDLLENGNFFIVLPLEEQLVDLMENQNICNEITESSLARGHMYRELTEEGTIRNRDLTLVWNSDGVPAFKSSGFAVWPIQCIVTELPPRLQKKHILMPGLWFGKYKPEMDAFLVPFVEECVKLATEGFNWNNPELGHIVNTRVHTLVCTSDSVARPLIRNCKQFNGVYGCDWCLHPGDYIPKGNGHARVYSQADLPNPPKRDHEQYFECGRQAAENDQPVFGIKGPSVCMLLPNFDLVQGFIPDYLHCVLLGVVRQTTKLWVESENKNKPWYLSQAKQRVVNKRLTEQKPPDEITRTPRGLDTRKYWKASEWRTFLLYYSLVVLKGILSDVYLNHWFLLVFALHSLLGKCVSEESAHQAERAIRKFVTQFEQHYGKENMTFNVHILLHLTDSVRNWGPLWATSTFSFESNNGTLMNLFRGTQSVPVQICHTFCQWRDLSRRSSRLLSECSIVKPIFEKLTTGIVHLKNAYMRHSDSLVTLGAVCYKRLSVVDRLCIEELLGRQLNFPLREVKYFKRFVLSGVLYSTTQYTRATKRINHYFQGHDDCYYRIENLVVLKSDCLCQNHVCHCAEMAFILVRKIVTGRQLYLDGDLHISCIHLKTAVNVERQTAVFPILVGKKCVVVTLRDTLHISPLPNPYERD